MTPSNYISNPMDIRLSIGKRRIYERPAYVESSVSESEPIDEWLYERLKHAGRFMDE